ncbi:MAG: hypothetical protein PVI97_00660 [Candidatus Thiodiazotropha sp.]|jgi:hypothetical protein
MAGRMCNGVATFYQYPLTESRAFCEGVAARYASNSPTNPHAAGSDAATSWDAGVAVAAAAAGGAVAKADAPCCAIPSGTVPV